MRLVTGSNTSPRRRARRKGTVKRVARVAALVMPAIALAGTGVWLWRSGIAQAAFGTVQAGVERTAGMFGLAVTDVYLTGRVNADKDEILATLGVKRGMPLLAFDPHSAKERLEALPWVQHAAVDRSAPGTIHVEIEERRPFALWQQDRHLFVVDQEGVILTDRDLDRFGSLLLLVGPDAPRHAGELLEIIGTQPDLAARVTAAVRVGNRRWNLRVDDEVEVKLPEEDAVAAWARLAELEQRHGLLRRDLASIDLRFPDRLLVSAAANELPMKPKLTKPKGKDHET